MGFGGQDRCLLLSFRLQDVGLFAALRTVDCRLLLALGLQDGRPLVLLGLFLFRHGLEHVAGWGDVEDFDAVEPDAPLERGLGHVVLHLGVDGLALGQ